MSDSIVYRVTFSGDWLPLDNASEREFMAAGVYLEASSGGVGPSRHWALVRADGPRRRSRWSVRPTPAEP